MLLLTLRMSDKWGTVLLVTALSLVLTSRPLYIMSDGDFPDCMEVVL